MFRNYDPGRVVVTFKGIRLLAPQDGTFVSAEREEDAFTKQVGSAGDVTRSRNRNISGSVTVTLQQASPTNDLLSALAEADELTGLNYGALMVKDLNGTTLLEAPNAWIRKTPTVEFAKEASGREWVFDCAQLIMNVGGSII